MPPSALVKAVFHFARSDGLEKASCAEILDTAGYKYIVLEIMASFEFHLVITSRMGAKNFISNEAQAATKRDFRLGEALRRTTTVSYTHLRAHETLRYLVCRLLLEKTKKIFKRNFRNKYACRNFMKNLNQRYFRRFKQNINFKLNLRGNKIMYYSGAKIEK